MRYSNSFTLNRILYETRPAIGVGVNGCTGCAFYFPDEEDPRKRLRCGSHIPPCKFHTRPDNKNVIFIKVKDNDTKRPNR